MTSRLLISSNEYIFILLFYIPDTCGYPQVPAVCTKPAGTRQPAGIGICGSGSPVGTDLYGSRSWKIRCRYLLHKLVQASTQSIHNHDPGCALLNLTTVLPSLQQELHTNLLFVSVLHRLWDYVGGNDKDRTIPKHLPDCVVSLLILALEPKERDMSKEIIQAMWTTISPHIGSWAGPLLEPETDDILRLHGELLKLGMYSKTKLKPWLKCIPGVEMLYPPHRYCANETCKTKLSKSVFAFVRIYTL